MALRLPTVLLVLALAVAGCGGSGGGSRAGGAKGPGKLVAEVSDAKAAEDAAGVTASAKVSVGGVAGRRLTLEWGLVDALLGNESQTERVVRRYVTTAGVVSATQRVHVPKSQINAPLLVHFVLYGPDGRYLASADTPEFGGATAAS